MGDSSAKETFCAEKSTPKLDFKPLYSICICKQSRKRDGKVVIILLLASGSVKQPNDVRAEFLNGWIVHVYMMWLPDLSDIDIITEMMINADMPVQAAGV